MSALRKQSGRAAFEIKKGPRQVMTLSESDVEKYLDLQELFGWTRRWLFAGWSWEKFSLPPRTQLSVAGKGFSLAMPA